MTWFTEIKVSITVMWEKFKTKRKNWKNWKSVYIYRLFASGESGGAAMEDRGQQPPGIE